MSLDVVVRVAATSELANAIDWYDAQRAGLGQELLADFDNMLVAIAQRPETFAAVYKSARRSRLKRLPYAIYFLIDRSTAVVLAVLHDRQDAPRHLKRRV